MRKNEKVTRAALLPTYIGTGVAFIAFLLVGAAPGMLYGGYMGLIISAALFGTPVEQTLVTRIITGGGMVLGLVATLFFFLVIGANLGTLAGWIWRSIARAFGPVEVEEAVAATRAVAAPEHTVAPRRRPAATRVQEEKPAARESE